MHAADDSKITLDMGMRMSDPDARVLLLHNIVFRCIPATLRVVLTTRTRIKFGVTFSGLWLLQNEHRVVPKLAKFQREMLQYNNVSRWDTSLLGKILLYSNLCLLAVQIPASNYTILSPTELLVTGNSVPRTTGEECCNERLCQKIIIHKRFGSTRFVAVQHTALTTESKTFLLKLSDRALAPGGLCADRIYICTKEWDAVRQMSDIRNQHAHRPSEKVTAVELKEVINKMNFALKSLNIQRCQHINGCICCNKTESSDCNNL